MGSPSIFSGRRTKLLTADGILNSNGSINDNDGLENYIKNSHAEVNTTGWATYADAASAIPVDGTGGVPVVTWTRTTTTPLSGQGSFLFTKDAVNRQGNGASYDFTIGNECKAKVLTIEFDYIVNSGTFVAGSSSVDSDLEIYIYDVTNAVIIQPSTYKLLSNSSTISDHFKSTFQTSSNSTSYRLIVHCATASANAYTIMFDGFRVGVSSYVFGSPTLDQVTQNTITFTGATTNPTKGTITNDYLTWKKNGDRAELSYFFRQSTAGTAGSGTYFIAMPTGLTIDTSKLSTNGLTISGAGTFIGKGTISSTNTANAASAQPVEVYAYDATRLVLIYNGGTTFNTSQTWSSSSGFTFASALLNISFQASVPILGWSSSVQMSDSADTRIVDFSGTKSATQAVTANTTDISFVTSKDSHGAWSGSLFTVPVAGDYIVSAAANETTVISFNLGIYRNGSLTRYLGYGTSGNLASGSAIVPDLKVGDTISIRSSSTMTVNTAANISISRISGPSAIAANELVAASYWLSANFTSSSTIPINFDSKEFDTHGAVTTGATTWRFTAPVSGTYSIQGVIDAANTYIYIYKNGTIYKHIGYTTSAGSIFMYPSSLIKLNAGDYIDFRCGTSGVVNGGATLATQTGANISISRVGF